MEKLRYCPVCGNMLDKYSTVCLYCQEPVDNALESKNDSNYYLQEAIKRFDTDERGLFGNQRRFRWYEVLLEEEISKNPLFDEEKFKQMVIRKDKASEYAINYLKTHSTSTGNVPKCPTCGSTNITKISAVKRATHAYAFGLFSKTAKSQFECKNCGYKW